ncbi:MAG: FG-GAP repeat protein [Marinobacter sp.]|nr:FG-GAP repeat protein [Marinobacter sp.]
MNKAIMGPLLLGAVLTLSGCGGSSGGGSSDSASGPNNPVNPTNPVDPVDPVDPGPGGTTYTISTNVTGPGAISPQQLSFTVPDDGTSAEFILTPNAGAGVKNFSGCGISPVSTSGTSGGAYRTGTINADCTVEVEFAQGFTVSQARGSFSTNIFNPVASRPPQFIFQGETATIDFSNVLQDQNSEVRAEGCDGAMGANNVFTTDPINADCTVNFQVQDITHALTLNKTGNGAVVSLFEGNAEPTRVSQAANSPLNILPDTGWYLEEVSGCGITAVANQSYNYQLPSATAPCTLNVTFAKNPVVTVRVGGDTSNWPVMPGETFTFTATPPPGNSLGSVTGCEANFENNEVITAAIVEDCTVDVNFIPGTTLSVAVESPKTLRFSWQPVTGAGEYRLEDSGSNLIETLNASTTEYVLTGVSLPLNIGQHYFLEACQQNGSCAASTNANRVDLTANDLIAGIAQLDPDVAATSLQQAFGQAVAVSRDGSTIAIGAPGPMTGTKETGRVSIWRNNNGSWTRLDDILPPSTTNVFEFGYALALSGNGNTLVVGAPGDRNRARGVFTSASAPGGSLDFESGAAYVFTYNQGQNRYDFRAYFKADPRTGSQELGGAAELASARFGHSVAISDTGNRVVVGAPGESNEYIGIYTAGTTNTNPPTSINGGSNSGAVFVYALTVSSNPVWQQMLYIKPSDTRRFSGFGWSVAANDTATSIAVGAPHFGVSGFYDNPEKLYVFDTPTVSNPNFNWGERGNFNLNGNRNQDLFGSAVAMSKDGNTIAVGAYAAGGFDGAAYIMHKEPMAAWGDAWFEKRSVVPQGLANSGMNFGYSLALTSDGSKLLVGAQTEGSNVEGLSSFASPGASNLHDQAGAAFLFSFDATAMTLSEDVLIKAPTPVESGRFGHAAAMSGNASTILIGEPSNGSSEGEEGRAYLY